MAPPGTRWTCLQLDLPDLLLVYLNRRHSHLKSVRLCASLLVRSLYTSDLCFDPGEGYTLRLACGPPALTLSALVSASLLVLDGHPSRRSIF